MGTRALVWVLEDKRPILRLHIQFDGYPNGIVYDALKLLIKDGYQLVNGYTRPHYDINGMDNFAALLVWALEMVHMGYLSKHLDKNNIRPPAGNIYVTWLSDDWYNYKYVFENDGDRIKLTVYYGSEDNFRPHDKVEKPLFEGPIEEFIKWVESNHL